MRRLSIQVYFGGLTYIQKSFHVLLFIKFFVLGILHPVKGFNSKINPKEAHKKCAYHQNQIGHTAEECVELRTISQSMVDSFSHLQGPYTILVCDQVEPGIQSMKYGLIHHYDFMTIVELYLGIYCKLVQAKILDNIGKKREDDLHRLV